MPRFVILCHSGGTKGVHFDFMLEAGDTLKTWAMTQPPTAGVEIDCDELPNHRTAYLDYEGPISGERGFVAQWDRGTYTVGRQNDAEWTVELAGERIAGCAVLRRTADNPTRWRFSLAGSP